MQLLDVHVVENVDEFRPLARVHVHDVDDLRRERPQQRLPRGLGDALSLQQVIEECLRLGVELPLQCGRPVRHVVVVGEEGGRSPVLPQLERSRRCGLRRVGRRLTVGNERGRRRCGGLIGRREKVAAVLVLPRVQIAHPLGLVRFGRWLVRRFECAVHQRIFELCKHGGSECKSQGIERISRKKST